MFGRRRLGAEAAPDEIVVLDSIFSISFARMMVNGIRRRTQDICRFIIVVIVVILLSLWMHDCVASCRQRWRAASPSGVIHECKSRVTKILFGFLLFSLLPPSNDILQFYV